MTVAELAALLLQEENQEAEIVVQSPNLPNGNYTDKDIKVIPVNESVFYIGTTTPS